MAWRDRLRRRAAGADGSGAGQSGRSGSGDSSGSVPGAPGDGGGTSGAGASGSSVPGDWDGGWRRTAPPPLTVARAPLGVSDGLTFRAGLASWQNPAFDNGLGHALLPTAPTGVVSGVTRPAAPQPTRTGGGPLLLRAVRQEGADAGDLGGGGQATGSGSSGSGSSSGSSGTTSRSAPSGAGPVVQRSADNSGAGKGRSGDAPRTRGITSAESPAVLSSPAPAVVTPADTGRSALAREIPLVRRVAVVPGATAGVPGSDSGSASRSPGGSGGRTTSGPAVQRAATESRPSPVAVQPRPVGPRLTVARRQAGPARRVPALRPAAPDTRPAPDTSAAPSAPAAGTTAPVQRAATRTGSRAPLGAPLSELPSTATPLAEGRSAPRPASGTGSAPGPALPVVQRQTEGGGTSDGGVQGTAQEGSAPRRTSDAGRSMARARGGLGAPLPALPPSAAVPGSTSSGAHASRGPDVQRAPSRRDGRGSATAPGRDGTSAQTTPPASGPDVQRAPSRQDGRGSAAGSGRDGTSAEAAPPAGGESGTDAPLLGSVDVQRRVTTPSATGDTTSPGHPTAHGTGPATPLVTPSQATASEGAATPATPAAPAGNAPRPGVQQPSTPGAPGPVVVARALAEGTPGADRPAAPAAPGGQGAAGTGSASPSVQAAPRGHGATGTLGAADPRALAEGTPGADRPAAPAASRGQGAAGTGSASPSVQAAPSTHGAPGPVVVARALAEGASDARTPGADRPAAPAAPRAGTPGAADSRSLPGAGSAAPSVQAASRTHGAPGPVVVARALAEGVSDARTPAADRPTAPAAHRTPRTLQLLPARPLTLSTRAPEGAAQPTATRPGNRPVVPMRWPGDQAAPQSQGGTGTPARPTPGPSSVTPATPHVQRAATPHPAPQNSGAGTTGSSAAVRHVPVVQLAPSHRETHGAPAAVPARSLPITAPQTPPLTDRPAASSAPASAGNVPVVRPRTSPPGGAAPPVQRAYSADDSALPGSMDKATPTRPRQPASAAGDLAEPAKPQAGNGRSASAKRTAQRAETPQDPGMDLDELARRLIDPVARLLRTELRRGRERTGRPYDGRR
ncbi:hypothetical protein [Streptomyces sp. GESEQ-4]|uniref:hypothetical protein n=1 Tax=Streptomyces sp. GESEQ-4 TaxID=2812655 RepID=UPI001B333923|nr:hypothetical protein [Streptomyces sp. GESEQ-4]